MGYNKIYLPSVGADHQIGPRAEVVFGPYNRVQNDKYKEFIMTKRILYILWGCMYALCAGLSHISQPGAAQSVALTILSVLFFVPPAFLLINALLQKDKKTLLILWRISAISLGLTVIVLLANVLSALGSTLLGDIMYEVLIFVSVPMVACPYWALSLFLWACLFFSAMPRKSKS